MRVVVDLRVDAEGNAITGRVKIYYDTTYTMKKYLLFAIFSVFFIAGSPMADEDKTTRPFMWAQPIRLTGVTNLYKISDLLYRSAQPTAEGMKNLKALGIRTIVNLRSFHSDRDEIGNTGLAYEHIYMKAWHPEKKELIRFFKIVNNPNRIPVLVHCQHGADRTGTMIAAYRIIKQGWSKKEAVREMTDGGFGFHRVWANLPKWVKDMDIGEIKKTAGME